MSAEPAVTAVAESPSTAVAVTRLHITPLDEELLHVVVPASVLPRARNVSFHAVQTFPERRYGFLDLPPTDAERIRTKLNGSVLRGVKMRVEKARPEKRAEAASAEEDKVGKKKKRERAKDGEEGSKKRKRDRDVVQGVVLEDRKVKRGWTEAPDYKKTKRSKKNKEKDGKDNDKEKRKRTKSKYTEQEECLVKVKVPPNAAKNLPEDDAGPRKKKRKGKSREVTVHEFEKTTKFPSFLKDSTATTGAKGAAEFVEGTGWVDADGNVVEPFKHKTRSKANPKKKKKEPEPSPKPVAEEEDDDDTSSSGTSSEDDSSSSDSEAEAEAEPERAMGGENEGEDSSEDEPSASPDPETPSSAPKPDTSRPTSSGSARNLTIKIPPPSTPAGTTKVHPLEALYKRQKSDTNGDAHTPPQEAQSFSFFGAGGDEEEDEEEATGAPPAAAGPMPMTPFTRQDLESRNVRSAAPTPDTAHPSRVQSFWASQGDEDEDGEEDDGVDGDADGGDAQAGGSGDFQAWFWENRRELNRSWMGRRKTAAKEKRYRENKARASKAV